MVWYFPRRFWYSSYDFKFYSFNNYNDICAALEILSSIEKESATVIIKHANPCGVAKNKSSLTSFKNAYACDPISAFGGVLACSFQSDIKIAQENYAFSLSKYEAIKTETIK